MARKADPTTRGKLLRAARLEFSEKGLDGARISSITSRAGVSKGAFYLHFKTKDHAFEEVASDFFQVFYRMIDELDAVTANANFQDIGKLHDELLERDIEILEFFWSERTFAAILFEDPHSNKHCHLSVAFTSHIQSQIERMLQLDRDRGNLRDNVDLETLGSFIAGGFERYARRLLTHPTKPDIRSDMAQLQEFMMRGLLPAHLLRDFSPPPISSVHASAERPLSASTSSPHSTSHPTPTSIPAVLRSGAPSS